MWLWAGYRLNARVRGEYGKIDLCLLAKPSGPKLSIVTHGMCEGHTMLGLGRYGPKCRFLGANISHFFPKLTFDPWGWYTT